MADLTVLEDDYRIWALFRNVAHLITTAQNRELLGKRTKVTIRQISILYVINMLGDKATPAEIARRQARAPTTISNICKRLEKMGLIHRSINPEKKNQIKLHLTKNGQTTLETAYHRDSLRRIMAVLNEEQRAQLKELTLLLRASVNKELGIKANNNQP